MNSIWVIDDDPTDRELTLAALREALPARPVEGFGSAREALERLADGERPSIVFVDWTLPGEDCSSAATRIRAYGAFTCLLTNLDCALIPERTGFDAFASKPYGFEALCQILVDVVDRAT